MSNTGIMENERQYIGVSFHKDLNLSDNSTIVPMIRLSESGIQKRTIRKVNQVKAIAISKVDFQNKKTTLLGIVRWPSMNFTSDIIIRYEPARKQGTVQLVQNNEVWSYSIEEPEPKKSTNIEPMKEQPIVDKEKVREIEEKRNQKRILWPDELTRELKKEILGQDEAIRTLSEAVAANLQRKTPEVLVMALFGRSGTGKTATAKALPKALKLLTGQEYGFNQISMNQFSEQHCIQQFFGAPPSYAGYKDPTIFEVCRSNPYQVFLLDEVEKAAKQMWTGLMEVFSNSSVRLLDNSPVIDLSHAIILMTSNLPIDMKKYNASRPFQKKELCRDTLTKEIGHPEVAGRIECCVAYQLLPGDTVTDIVTRFVSEELKERDMNLVQIDPDLMVELKRMYCPVPDNPSPYGARAVRDAVRTALNFLTYDRNLGKKYYGKNVRLEGNVDDIRVLITA